jgi:hypothetical protein
MLPTDFQAAKPKRAIPSRREVGAISARRPARWNGTAYCGDSERAPQFPSSQSSESHTHDTTSCVIRQAEEVQTNIAVRIASEGTRREAHAFFWRIKSESGILVDVTIRSCRRGLRSIDIYAWHDTRRPFRAPRDEARRPATGRKLIFLELGLSPEAAVGRWQKRWEPAAYWLFEGLHLTRDMPSLLVKGGFHVDTLEATYLATFPKSWTSCCWGTARVSGSI